MLATLFNNISIPSLARALIFTVLCAVLSAWWAVVPQEGLRLAVLHMDVAPWLYTLLLALLPVAVGYGLNSGINASGYLKQSYQFLPVYAMLTLGLFIVAEGSVELLIALPLGALLVYRLIVLVKSINPSYILFDTGVLTGIMALLVPETAFFLILIWLATFNFGHGGFRTMLMPIMGVGAVYFIVFALLYWMAGFNGIEYLMHRYSEMQLGFHLKDTQHALVYIPLILLIIPALLETAQIYGKASVQKRQLFTFLVEASLLIVIAGTFVENSPNLWVWLSIPLAILVVNLINYRKKRWQKDLVYVMLIAFLALSLLV